MGGTGAAVKTVRNNTGRLILQSLSGDTASGTEERISPLASGSVEMTDGDTSDALMKLAMKKIEAEQQEAGMNNLSVKEQLRNSQDTLRQMQPAANVQTPKSFSQLDIAGKIKWVIEKLRPTGYQVERKGMGTIKFGSKQLKGAFKYFTKGSVEEAAFEALPYVLENGVQIAEHTDHKDRSYGTVTIAAPVIIDGQRGNMAVVVKKTTENFYKVHRILTPEGAVFNFSNGESEAEPTSAGELPVTGSLATPISSASNTSISEGLSGVNGENLPVDRALLADKDFRRSTGQVVQVQKFTDFTGGKATVMLADGSTAPASDISFADNGDEVVFHHIAAEAGMTPLGANTIWQLWQSQKKYTEGADAIKWTSEALQAWRAGMHGETITTEGGNTAGESQGDNGFLHSGLTSSGRNDRWGDTSSVTANAVPPSPQGEGFGGRISPLASGSVEMTDGDTSDALMKLAMEKVDMERDAELENSTNAITNPIRSYPAEKQSVIRSYLGAVDEKIKSFVKSVKNGDLSFKRQKISNVSNRSAKDIGDLLGIDVSGYTHNINTNGVQHIINRHGSNGEHDLTMSIDDDIARVGWILDNYDTVEIIEDNGKQKYSAEFRDSDNKPAPQIRFVKKIDGTYYVVEAACENQYKKLWVQSAYLQKNEDVTQVPTADQVTNRERHAQSELASPSSPTSIPEEAAGVNGENSPVDGALLADKDFRRSTGQVVQVQKFTDFTGGKATVMLADGSTAPASDISFADNGDEVVFHHIAAEAGMTPLGANTIWQLWQSQKKYTEGADAIKWMSEALQAWRAGLHGETITTEGGNTAGESQGDNGFLHSGLTSSGRNDRWGDTSSVTANAVPPSPQGEGFGGRISPRAALGRNDTGGRSDAEGRSPGTLTGEQQRMIYDKGQRAAGEKADTDQARIDQTYQQAQEALGQDGSSAGGQYGATVADGIQTNKLSRAQRTILEMADLIAKGVKTRIVLYNGGKEWGCYRSGDDTIRLNINARWNHRSMMVFTLGHELVHRAKLGSPKKYKAFADFLIKEYGKKGIDLETLIAEQLAAAEAHDRQVPAAQRLNMDREAAFEEVVADACQRMLLDTEAGKRLAEFGAQSKENRRIAGKVGQWIRELVDRLRNFFRNVTPDSLAAKAFAELEENTKQILADLFVDMSRDAGEKLSTIREAGMTGRINDSSVKNKLGMSQADIQAVQSIGRKSVSRFSAADIKATEGFARQYWKEMGTKSPFFRGWFGDWRANDQTRVQIATQKGNARGVQKNTDTGWDIQVSGKVFNETRMHTGSANKSAQPYLTYIDDIVQKAVLLDSYGMGQGKEKSANSLLMHSLYTVADIGNGLEIIKLYVEEMNNPNAEKTGKRAYQLQNIEKQQLSAKGSSLNSSPVISTATIRTVADLFAAVKQKDSSFQPKPASKVVNPDGTPKEVYHGTPYNFTAFNGGAFFTDDYWNADGYASGETVVEAYLDMKNPLIIDAQGRKWDNLSTPHGSSTREIVANAGGKYDGVIFENINDSWIDDEDAGDESTVYYVFRNTQIKSATDNIGTFDGNDQDVRYKLPVQEGQSDRRQLAEKENTTNLRTKTTYSYKSLIQKPDMQVIEVGGNVPEKRADIIAQAKKNAVAIGKYDAQTGNISVFVNDIGEQVVIGTQGLRHGLDRRNETIGVVTLKAGEIIKSSIRINELTPKKEGADASYILVGAASDGDGNIFVVRSVVNRFNHHLVSMDVLYAINAKKENRLRSVRPGLQSPVTGSTISIADLLDYVNEYFPDILPEDVLKHYGYDSRHEGDLGNDVLYKLPVQEGQSDRRQLADLFEQLVTNSNEHKIMENYRQHIEEMLAIEEQLERLDAEIRRLSFGEGPRDTEQLTNLKIQKQKAINRLNYYDNRLLSLEKSGVIKGLIDRYRQKITQRSYEKAKEYYRERNERRENEIRQYYRESRRKAVERHDMAELRQRIRKDVQRLDSLLNKGSKKKNVKEGLREVVGAALRLAKGSCFNISVGPGN